jgi:hypothetical protein
MILTGALKVFIKRSSKYVEFVDLWFEIAKQSKHIYFVHFDHLFVQKKMCSENIISNWYEVQRNLFTLVVRGYIVDNLTSTCTA